MYFRIRKHWFSFFGASLFEQWIWKIWFSWHNFWENASIQVEIGNLFNFVRVKFPKMISVFTHRELCNCATVKLHTIPFIENRWWKPFGLWKISTKENSIIMGEVKCSLLITLRLLSFNRIIIDSDDIQVYSTISIISCKSRS